MGWRKPNCLMLDATFSIAAEQITRGFLAYGTRARAARPRRAIQIDPNKSHLLTKIEFRGRARVASAAVNARPNVEI